MKARNAGFTAIEVILGCVVLAVLFSLLFVALQRAMGTRGEIGCLQNLRNIGTAISLYANDNGGVLPGPSSVSMDSRYTRNLVSSRTHLTHFLIPYLIDGYNQTETLYLPAFLCPAAKKVLAPTELSGGPGKTYTQTKTVLPSGARTEYPFGNRENGKPVPDPPLRLTQLTDPPNTIALCDRATVVGYPDPVHKDRRNFLFLDGHVETVLLERIEASNGIRILRH